MLCKLIHYQLDHDVPDEKLLKSLFAFRFHVYLTHLSLAACPLITDRGLQPLTGELCSHFTSGSRF